MGIFSKVTKIFAPKQAPVTVQKVWRNGMWVIHHGKIAVIANLGNPLTEIHYADKVSGETLSANFVSLDELRLVTARFLSVAKELL
jgi:hypothetical protein